MCLGLVKIYPNGKWTMYQMLILMISNSFVFKIVSFEVIKCVIRPSLKHSILNFERIHSHAPVFRTLEGLNKKSHEYQYCSTHQDLHLIYWPFLHLTKCWEGVVEYSQFSHIVSYSLCEIQDLVSIVYLNFLKWKNGLYKKFGSWWSLTTCYSNVFHFK